MINLIMNLISKICHNCEKNNNNNNNKDHSTILEKYLIITI